MEPETVYPAGAFDPESGARVAGELRIAGSVYFSCEKYSVELPLLGLELSLGGASDRLVFLGHQHQPDVSIFTSDHAVLADATLLGSQSTAHQIASIGRKKMAARVVLATILLTLVAAAVGLILAKDPLVNLVVDRVPPELEVRLGELFFSQITATTSLIEDPDLTDQLQQLLDPLLAAIPDTGYPFKFHIANDPTLNAFALPGGHVVIHGELLLFATEPEEVLGVLAHEIAHVTCRHSLRNVVSSLGLLVIVRAVVGDSSGLLTAVAEGGRNLLTLGFSRDFEREADDVGWQYMVNAGVDPRGMLRLFARMQAEAAERDGDAASIAENLSFLTTHPATTERIERLERRWNGGDRPATMAPARFDYSAFQERLRLFLRREEGEHDESTG